jgi:DNA-binding NarL/FixJ family response regulator
MPAQIMIVDDSYVLRRSIRSCIEENTDWEVCGEAENGQIAIERVGTLHPDLVILDLAMPIMNGLDAARQIAKIDPDITMVLFTMHSSQQLMKDAKAAGIKTVLSKSVADVEDLLTSLKTLIDAASLH